MTTIRQLACLAITLLLVACGKSADEGNMAARQDDSAGAAAANGAAIQVTELMPGLSMRRMREGTGAAAKPGQIAVVHYTGWLYDESAKDKRGNKFDSSLDRGVHFEFPLGAGKVIRGWDAGVVGMKIGEIRELTIAPELAYGNRQVGDVIPPGSTLVFEVELAALKEPQDKPAAH